MQLRTLYHSASYCHARFACFVLKRNQHFVGSARNAGLCWSDEVGNVEDVDTVKSRG